MKPTCLDSNNVKADCLRAVCESPLMGDSTKRNQRAVGRPRPKTSLPTTAESPAAMPTTVTPITICGAANRTAAMINTGRTNAMLGMILLSTSDCTWGQR